jgi:hypothetical protein
MQSGRTAEIDILELLKPEDYRNSNIQKLVFEYSFDFDKSIPRFLKIVDTLKEYFRVVEFSKFKEGENSYSLRLISLLRGRKDNANALFRSAFQ